METEPDSGQSFLGGLMASQADQPELSSVLAEPQDLIKKAIQPLKDEIQVLKDIIARQGEKIAVLEATQDSQADNELNQLRLIADLRKGMEPQPLQKDRGEILRAFLAANNGRCWPQMHARRCT